MLPFHFQVDSRPGNKDVALIHTERSVIESWKISYQIYQKSATVKQRMLSVFDHCIVNTLLSSDFSTAPIFQVQDYNYGKKRFTFLRARDQKKVCH